MSLPETYRLNPRWRIDKHEDCWTLVQKIGGTVPPAFHSTHHRTRRSLIYQIEREQIHVPGDIQTIIDTWPERLDIDYSEDDDDAATKTSV